MLRVPPDKTLSNPYSSRNDDDCDHSDIEELRIDVDRYIFRCRKCGKISKNPPLDD